MLTAKQKMEMLQAQDPVDQAAVKRKEALRAIKGKFLLQQEAEATAGHLHPHHEHHARLEVINPDQENPFKIS